MAATPPPKAETTGDSSGGDLATPAPRPRPPGEPEPTRRPSTSDSDPAGRPPSREEGRAEEEEEEEEEEKEGGRSSSEPQQRVERSPSFTSEWDEIEKIMSLIGAGIESSSEQQPTPTDGGAGARAALERTVGEWLERAGLPQYESRLLINGFDDLHYMGSNVMEDHDLRELGITDPGHRKKILHAARNLPKMKALGCDGSTSLSSWLDVLGLQEYLPNFLSSGYRTLECVKNLWELEIVNVLKIGPLGHRKRIIASLAERPYEEGPSKSQRLAQISFQDLLSQGPSSLSQVDPYTSRSMDMLLPLGEAGRRRRGQDQDCSVSLRSYSERPRSVDRQSDRQSDRHRDARLNLRPPSQSATYASVPSWHHQPEKLVLESCGYEASYLGSMVIRDLRGIESTQEACAKIRKSKDARKGPVIILSITYKGVRFIDAATKTIIAEHEIRNISCAAQDPDDLCTFAYITKDLKSGHHFCHVFSTVEVTQTYEIILTLGQAFEVAYQIALQARARQYVPPATLGSEVIETKASRPVSQSWSSTRRSTIDPLEADADMQSLGSTSWLFDPRDSGRRPGSTKYETTIF